MPKLPATTKDLLRAVRAYSPITTDQRHTMERSLRSISSTTRFGPKEAQKIADAFRPPLVQVGRAAVAGFVEYGYWLQRLHDRCPHGLWLSLFTGAGSRDGIVRPIPMSRQQAQALLRIAKHPLLSNPDVIDQLPPHWRTLDTLTRVPDAVLDEGFTKGRIHVKMERAEAEALIPRTGTWTRRAEAAPEMPATASASLPRSIQRQVEAGDAAITTITAAVRAHVAQLDRVEAGRYLDALEALVHECQQARLDREDSD